MSRTRSTTKITGNASAVGGGSAGKSRRIAPSAPLRLFDDADFGYATGTADPAVKDGTAVMPDSDIRQGGVPSARQPTEPNMTTDGHWASAIHVDRPCPDNDPCPARTTADDGACQKPTHHEGGTSARNVDGAAGCDLLAPRLVTIAVAARLLGVGRTTIYELIARGDIDTVHIGRSARVPVCSLDAFVSKLQTRAQNGS
jgi:excisionase family DNA binding protein